MSQRKIQSFFSAGGASPSTGAAPVATSGTRNVQPEVRLQDIADEDEEDASDVGGRREGDVGGRREGGPGARPAQNKKAKTSHGGSQSPSKSSDTVPASRRYEAKRKRRFLEKWRQQFNFVEYDYGADVMYCKTCRAVPEKADGNVLFHGVTGDTIRSRALTGHVNIDAHVACQAALDARENPEQAPIRRALQHLNNAVEDKMIKLFNTAYYVAREEAPFTSFPKLVGLQVKNGQALGETYRNDQGCRTFVAAIGEVEMDKLVENVRKARFFSVMSDSSMDRAILDQELIYITFIQDGLPVNHLVNIVTLEHAHATGILDAILTGLERVGLNREDLTRRLVGFGSDGAAVMIGVNNGVGAKLKQFCPSIITVWCVAHRLELAALDTIKEHPLLKDLKEALKSIFKHYTDSAKASRELRDVGELLGVQVVKPGNINGCRWLPHMSRALEALVRNYKAIMVHFENHANDHNNTEASATMRGRAKVIYRSLSRYKMVKFIHLMVDVLKELREASLLFQKDGLTLQDVSDGLSQVTLAMMAMQTTPGPSLQGFLNAVGEDSTYLDVKLSGPRGEQEDMTFMRMTDHLIDDFCSFVTSRFGNLEEGVLKAASTLFNHSTWPNEVAEVQTYGNDALEVFMAHFQPILDSCEDFQSTDMARREWRELKLVVTRHFMHLPSCTVWQRFLQGTIGRPNQFSHMKVLVEMYLVIPMNSSCCERGFSSMKRIKSDWRSSLGNEMLNNLLQISIHGTTVDDYDPEAAIHKWYHGGMRMRRPELLD
ncbi:ZNF862 [Branchiostoma lanceolatum]|uniref:ZNF862 protein n=1 Tax=Branchiostoma lanceolatum TaxID=7740 RepID=A0A8J9ZZP1_BRALA|nr:ZNF862 [Branchiostoma lanceolatum]